MERTKFPVKSTTSSSENRYNIQEEPIVLSKILLDTLLKEENPSDLIALYCFYYYTAKWQKTNQPKATTEYVAAGLRWSMSKVRKIKKQLIFLSLIKDVSNKGINGTITGHYVHINFIWSKSHPSCNPEGGEPHTVANIKGNALNSNKENALNSNKENALLQTSNLFGEYITSSLFETFWKIYPRKMKKGKANDIWNTLCSSKNRPLWKDVHSILKIQIASDQWKDEQFIPYPTTWLEDKRWLDDPSEYKKRRFSKDTPITGYTEKDKTYRDYDAII